MGQVRVPVSPTRRGANGNEDGISRGNGIFEVRGEMQTARRDIAGHDGIKARLIDRHVPLVEHGNLFRRLVDADHFMTKVRETDT